MKFKIASLFLSLFVILGLSGCIKDDIIFDEIDPVLRITTKVDSIGIGTDFQFEAMYLNSVGAEEAFTPTWATSDESILTINESGLSSAIEFGSVFVSVTYNNGEETLKDSLWVAVGENTVVPETTRSGTVETTSSYELFGDFTITEEGDDIRLSLASNYVCSTALPGAYVYLSNNAASIADALEIGPVEVFSGAHDYLIPDTGINDFTHVVYFCKPFNIKVGDGEIE